MKRWVVMGGILLLVGIFIISNNHYYAFTKKPWPERAYGFAEKGFDTCLGRLQFFAVVCYYHQHPDWTQIDGSDMRKIEKYCRKTGGEIVESIDSYKAEFLLTCGHDGLVMQILVYVPHEEEKNDAPWTATVTYFFEGSPEEWKLENSRPSIW